MAKRRKVLKRRRKRVPVVLERGTGRWLMLLCAQGHLIQQFPYGTWSDVRRKYGRKNANVLCGACYQAGNT